MVRTWLVVLVVLLMTTAVSAGEWAIYGLSVPAPEQNDTFDNGVGVEGQYRIPIGDDMAIAGILGLNRWEADTYRFDSCWMNAKVSGDVTAFVVGAGVIWQLPLGLSAEVDLKHHIMSSDVDVDVHMGRLALSNELEYDNLTTIGALLNLELDLATNTAAIIGAGYQWDIGKEDVKLAGFKTPLRNGLEGIVFKAGLVIRTP